MSGKDWEAKQIDGVELKADRWGRYWFVNVRWWFAGAKQIDGVELKADRWGGYWFVNVRWWFAEAKQIDGVELKAPYLICRPNQKQDKLKARQTNSQTQDKPKV